MVAVVSLQSAKNFRSQMEEMKSIAVARGYQPVSLPLTQHTPSSRPLVSESIPPSKPTVPDKTVVSGAVENHIRSEKTLLSPETKEEGIASSGGSQGEEDVIRVSVSEESSLDSTKVVSSPIHVARNVSICVVNV